MQKRCFKCGETKFLSEFYRHPQMADGHLNKCKECAKRDARSVDPEKRRAYEKERTRRPERRAALNEYGRIARLLDPERFREYQRSYVARHRERVLESKRAWKEANPEKWAEIQRRYDVANPEKRKAHRAVKRALAAGTLLRSPCECCGSSQRVHAHHDDYAKPLDVRWLCPKCHKDTHRRAP